MAERPDHAAADPLPLYRPEDSHHLAAAVTPAEPFEYMGHLWRGVAVVAAFYPLIAIGLVCQGRTLWALASGTWGVHYIAGAISALPGIMVAAVVGGALVAFIACAVMFLVLYLVWWGKRLLGLNLSWPALGAFCGGVTGFVFWAPIIYSECARLISPPLGFTRGQWPQLMLLSLGPMLAMFLGQVGGALGGYNAVWFLGDDPAVFGKPSKRFSFSIRQLLALTVLVSVFMALLRVAGLLTPAMLVLVSGWLVWQTISRRLAMWLARRLSRGRRRQTLLPVPPSASSGGSFSGDMGGA